MAGKKISPRTRKYENSPSRTRLRRETEGPVDHRIRVNMEPGVLESLIEHAKGGYEVPYKTEVGGHLLGFFSRDDGLIHIRQAVPYHTPCAGRTYFSPNFQAFERKGRLLERGQRRWVGVYHSHPETGGRASALPSPEDMKSHREAPIPLELIVRVSPFLMNSPKSSFTTSCGLYYYDISCFVKDEEDRIRPAGGIVVDEQ